MQRYVFALSIISQVVSGGAHDAAGPPHHLFLLFMSWHYWQDEREEGLYVYQMQLVVHSKFLHRKSASLAKPLHIKFFLVRKLSNFPIERMQLHYLALIGRMTAGLSKHL